MPTVAITFGMYPTVPAPFTIFSATACFFTKAFTERRTKREPTSRRRSCPAISAARIGTHGYGTAVCSTTAPLQIRLGYVLADFMVHDTAGSSSVADTPRCRYAEGSRPAISRRTVW